MKKRNPIKLIGALLLAFLLTLEQGAQIAHAYSASGSRPSNPRVAADGTVTWDCVWFGKYWQEDTDGDGKVTTFDDKQPIKWRVLSVDGNDAFLLADQVLDKQRYNEKRAEVTWETSTIRSWLNGYGASENRQNQNYQGKNHNFISMAFSSEEQDAIIATLLENKDNQTHGTDGGNDTTDSVFLLSEEEIMNPSYGFAGNRDASQTREATETGYVKDGGSLGTRYDLGYWLRTTGEKKYDALRVYGSRVPDSGYIVEDDCHAVRPALHLDLSSSCWSSAGTSGSWKNDGDSTGSGSGGSVSNGHTSPENPAISDSGMVTWDCVQFGNFWQSDTNGDGKVDETDEKEPIKWRVLSVDGNDAFLLADRNLYYMEYGGPLADAMTWEMSSVRSWLNAYGSSENYNGEDYQENGFLKNAFSDSEQAAIPTTDVVTPDKLTGDDGRIEGGPDTRDKVFLLSTEEACTPAYGFNTDIGATEVRVALNTEYPASVYKYSHVEPQGYADSWWLRSPHYFNKKADGKPTYSNVAALIKSTGTVYPEDAYGSAGVRPALHLNLSSSGWKMAGTVSAPGGQKPSGGSSGSSGSSNGGSSNGTSGSSSESGSSSSAKKTQTITASDLTKTEGDKDFYLGAKTSGDGKLSYKGSDSEVASVFPNGQVFINGPGTAQITITASETAKYKAATKTITLTVKPRESSSATTKKKAQKITARNVTKVAKYGGSVSFNVKAFKAKTSGNGKLSYNSSDSKVASVLPDGTVLIYKPGKVIITITASETAKYKEATKKVTLTVKPCGMSIDLYTPTRKKAIGVEWYCDMGKPDGVTGYQFQWSTDRKFKKNVKTGSLKSEESDDEIVGEGDVEIRGLKPGKTYYVRARAYAGKGKGKVVGKYSAVKKIKVKK